MNTTCCREPKVWGGRCNNCGTWIEDMMGIPGKTRTCIRIDVDGTITDIEPKNGKGFSLREIQEYVGGWVEPLYRLDGRPTDLMLIDEEGHLKGLPLNEVASQIALRPIVGPVVIVPTRLFK